MTAARRRATNEAVRLALAVVVVTAGLVVLLPNQGANALRVGLGALACVALIAAARALLPERQWVTTGLDRLPAPLPEASAVPESLQALRATLQQGLWQEPGRLVLPPMARARLRDLADATLRPLGASLDTRPGLERAATLLRPDVLAVLVTPTSSRAGRSMARRDAPAEAIDAVLDELARLEALDPTTSAASR